MGEQLVILALIQGITEFLPISSSSHLIIPNKLLGWEDQGLVFDVAVHLGSLGAVILVLRKRIKNLSYAILIKFGRQYPRQARLGWLIAIATIPVVLIGYLLASKLEEIARNLWLIAFTTIVFALILWWAEKRAKNISLSRINIRSALIIGLAQVLALVPGTSRSGVTLSACFMLGLGRRTSVEFSFLMSIPVIFGANVLMVHRLAVIGLENVPWLNIILAILITFTVAVASIKFLLGWIEKIGIFPFVLYRLAVGIFLLWFCLFI